MMLLIVGLALAAVLIGLFAFSIRDIWREWLITLGVSLLTTGLVVLIVVLLIQGSYEVGWCPRCKVW